MISTVLAGCYPLSALVYFEYSIAMTSSMALPSHSYTTWTNLCSKDRHFLETSQNGQGIEDILKPFVSHQVAMDK